MKKCIFLFIAMMAISLSSLAEEIGVFYYPGRSDLIISKGEYYYKFWWNKDSADHADLYMRTNVTDHKFLRFELRSSKSGYREPLNFDFVKKDSDGSNIYTAKYYNSKIGYLSDKIDCIEIPFNPSVVKKDNDDIDYLSKLDYCTNPIVVNCMRDFLYKFSSQRGEDYIYREKGCVIVKESVLHKDSKHDYVVLEFVCGEDGIKLISNKDHGEELYFTLLVNTNDRDPKILDGKYVGYDMSMSFIGCEDEKFQYFLPWSDFPSKKLYSPMGITPMNFSGIRLESPWIRKSYTSTHFMKTAFGEMYNIILGVLSRNYAGACYVTYVSP